MFTDMVGYSALAQRNEALALELLEEHRRIVRGILPSHGGREVKTTGDGFLLEFSSALEATQCAVALQKAHLERNQSQPAERQIRIRIGIHVGDVVAQAGDIHGDGVNVAARIEPLATPGGICVTRAVFEQIENKVPQKLVQLSRPELKNISANVEVYRLVLDGAGAQPSATRARKILAFAVLFVIVLNVCLLLKFGGMLNSPRQVNQTGPAKAHPGTEGSRTDQKSVAVLPFVNMSADKDNEYFSDGVAEEILNALACTPGLRVAARTSAFSFKGRNESVQQIGTVLNVGYLLEGSVRRAGDRLRITAQLINVADGFHLWSEEFDRKTEDVFAVQSEVAQRVQEALKVKLLTGTGSAATLPGTDNLEAYDLYLRARQFWNLRTADDVQRAVGLFQQATEKDPRFGAAYAGLALAYAVLPEYAALPYSVTHPKALAAARRALELDGTSAEAHAVLGTCAADDWDLETAAREYQEALRLNPNNPTSHHWYSMLLADEGRWDEALAEARKAQSLDPLSPVIQSSLGERLFLAGRYDESLAAEDKALKLRPDFPNAHLSRGEVFLATGRMPEAVAEFEQMREKAGDTPFGLGYLGCTYARAGRTNEARQVLEKLQNALAGGHAVSYEIALVHVGLGEADQAFVWLERAADSRQSDPRAWQHSPLLTGVVKDPRYAVLLRKFGFAK
jgi:TolB-like protein/class 3 adenylate cyclase/Flp pilus assembly protein TadD